MSIERELTPIERLLTWSAFSIVTIVARIKGEVTETMLQSAVTRAQQKHPVLQARLEQDGSILSFTRRDAGEIPVKVIPKSAGTDWIKVTDEEKQVPFDFETRPAIRFILLQTDHGSDLIIFAHHLICDGISLAHLAHDLLTFLGDSSLVSKMLPAPVPMGQANIPPAAKINPLVKMVVNRIRKKWQQEKVVFDQEDYRALHHAYWQHFDHRMFSLEFSEEETSRLVARCKAEGVTVNSALAAAVSAAQAQHLNADRQHPAIAVAGNLRGRMVPPVGNELGFFAGAVTATHEYDLDAGFWENARQIHGKLQKLFTDKNLFAEPLMWSHLDPTYLEAINFKQLGGLVRPESDRGAKLQAFAQQEDVVSSIMKRNKMDALDKVFTGAAVTNLTRMDFPTKYGDLELDRLIIKPGGAFPLATFNFILGAVTCSDKLSLVIEYAEQGVDTETMTAVKDHILELLRSI